MLEPEGFIRTIHYPVMTKEGDTVWMPYHAYDAKGDGISKLRIESIAWDADGWPRLPSQDNRAASQ